nr:chemotaxis protein CheW [candidate division Zixibacteria bacterium]
MNPGNKGQYLCARIKGFWMGIEVSRVAEIISSDIAGGPANELHGGNGTFAYRGNNIPIISLTGILFDDYIHYEQSNRILVIEWDGNLFGLTVDSVDEILRITDENVIADQGSESDFKADIFEGAIIQQNKKIFVVSLERVFDLVKQS